MRSKSAFDQAQIANLNSLFGVEKQGMGSISGHSRSTFSSEISQPKPSQCGLRSTPKAINAEF